MYTCIYTYIYIYTHTSTHLHNTSYVCVPLIEAAAQFGVYSRRPLKSKACAPASPVGTFAL